MSHLIVRKYVCIHKYITYMYETYTSSTYLVNVSGRIKVHVHVCNTEKKTVYDCKCELTMCSLPPNLRPYPLSFCMKIQ